MNAKRDGRMVCKFKEKKVGHAELAAGERRGGCVMVI